MYLKLALRNFRRTAKDYIVYFITLALAVSLFYGFLSLSSTQYYTLVKSAKFDLSNLYSFLKYSSIAISMILLFLINYVNNYMMKIRSNEFALYSLLGMNKKRIAFSFFIEVLLIGWISIVFGIIIGSFISGALTNIILAVIGQKRVLAINLFLDTAIYTIIFFCIIFMIIAFKNAWKLSKMKIIDLINSNKKNDIQIYKNNKFYIFMILLTIACYVFSLIQGNRYLNIRHLVNVDVNQKNFIFLQLIISIVISTISLFYSFSYIIVVIKRKFINYKYRKENLFILGNLTSKIRTIPILLSAITLLMMGAFLSFTISSIMAQWATGFANYKNTYDGIISTRYNDIYSLKDIPKLNTDEIKSYIIEHGYNIKDSCEFNKFFIHEDDFGKRKKTNFPTLTIKLSDYNKLREMAKLKPIKLEKGQYAIHFSQTINKEEKQTYEKVNELNLENKKYMIKQKETYNESLGGEYLFNDYTDAIYILSDEMTSDLIRAESDFYFNTSRALDYDFAKKLDTFAESLTIKNNQKIYDKYKNIDGFQGISDIRTKTESENEGVVGSLIIRMIGIYTGIIVLIICLTILSLNQLYESIQQKRSFNVLRKLGVNKKEINSIIRKQISLYFNFPMIISLFGYGVITTIYLKSNYNEIIGYVGFYNLMRNIGYVLSVGILIYAIYFVLTILGFKRNIENIK